MKTQRPLRRDHRPCATRTGTCYFVNTAAAKQAYGDAYQQALAEGRIIVGTPDTSQLHEDDILVIDRFGRYWIEWGAE